MSNRAALALGLFVALGLPAVGQAQERTWEFAVAGGALRNDVVEDDATDLSIGGRFARYTSGGWGVGAALDWIGMDSEIPIEGGKVDVDVDQFLYGVTVDKSFEVSPRARFVVGSGVGAATARYSDLPRPAGGVRDVSETNLFVPIGAGVKLLNRAQAPSWGLRFDVRDNLVFVGDDAPAGLVRDDDVVQQWQASAGISFFFGGKRSARLAENPAAPTAPMRRAAEVEDDAMDPARERALAEVGEKIFFDFDRYELKPASRETLQRKAEALRSLPEIRIVIEGHADERGTIEYNLALGERRANAARRYLIDLGIDPERLAIVSYGEERPAVDGHNEAAWSQNRRDEFVPGGATPEVGITSLEG